jgi:hypothetical protein
MKGEPMIRDWALPALAALAFVSVSAEAGHPISSRLARQDDGPYAPQVNRYVVVDPTPVPAGPIAGVRPAASGGMHKHGHAAAQGSSQPGTSLWVRRDLTAPAYPYGWFGVRPATNRWSHTNYYGDYTDMRIDRGR